VRPRATGRSSAANTRIADTTSVYLRYDGELAGGNTSHILSGGVRIAW